jgi:hypothetical protein
VIDLVRLADIPDRRRRSWLLVQDRLIRELAENVDLDALLRGMPTADELLRFFCGTTLDQRRRRDPGRWFPR